MTAVPAMSQARGPGVNARPAYLADLFSDRAIEIGVGATEWYSSNVQRHLLPVQSSALLWGLWGRLRWAAMLHSNVARLPVEQAHTAMGRARWERLERGHLPQNTFFLSRRHTRPSSG